MSEAEEFQKYADLKSNLESILCEFRKVCDAQGRDPDDEIEDCVIDSNRG